MKNLIAINLLFLALASRVSGAQILDSVYFGDSHSEATHHVAWDNSEVRTGGLGQACRVILPNDPSTISGGSITFTLRCDLKEQNYLTARLWGGDVGETALYLYHEDKQLGSKHNDWPPLDTLNWRTMEPRLPGRFFYMTYMLPESVTKGCRKITLKLVSKGYTYGYASTYEDAQHDQEAPSQGVYALYMHTDPFFVPLAEEPQGEPVPLGAPRPAAPGADVYESVRVQTQRLIDSALRRQLPSTQETLGIAKAYGQPWSSQHKNQTVLRRIVETVDAYTRQNDISSLGWFGPGELAMAIVEVYDEAEKAGLLDQAVGGSSRREEYADFFKRTLDYQTEPKNRGGLTNQDIYIITSVYRTNLLLKKITPDKALAEDVALDCVYQAIGLRPYHGRHYPGEGVTPSTDYRYIIGGPIFLADDWDYYWVTPKGSSKEHGYVCYYGELAHQLATLAALTQDESVREQATKMIAARGPFRVFDNDNAGRIVLRIEATVGWPHNWYAGRVEYADPYFKAAAVLQDPVSVRLAQLYLEHNRAFENVDRPELPLMVERVNNLKAVLQMPPSEFRLPTRDDQPDFAWADEGIGAVVFKHNGRRAWIVMSWRAAGVNRITRAHFTEPAFDRIANVLIHCQYTPSGKFIVRPEERCGAFVEPGAQLVTDDQLLPLAEGPLDGKGDFYSLRYGDYLIAMNCTEAKTFDLQIPREYADRELLDLVTATRLPPADMLQVQPNTTVVLYLKTP